MVAEVRPNHESDWAAITAVAAKLSVGTAETVHKWVRQAQVDAGAWRHDGRSRWSCAGCAIERHDERH
jgi:transposase-like protein